MAFELPDNKTGKDAFLIPIEIDELKISSSDVFSEIGYGKETPDSHFEETILNIIKEIPGKVKIKAGYKIVEFSKPAEIKSGFYLDDIFLEAHKIVTGQLKKSEMAAIFVCTIGTGMEEWSKKEAANGNTLESYFIDAVASVTVEKCADFLHDYIHNKMDESGLKITNRYSPGYCNWSVSDQRKLFSFLPPGFCGISLTDSSLMVPVKSISGIIGIGHNVKWNEYQCKTCGVKDCTYRMKKMNSAG